MKKLWIGCNFFMTCLAVFLFASAAAAEEGFDNVIMPMSNPVYTVGGALNKTFVRPVYLYQLLPDKVDTTIDGVLGVKDLKLGGHVSGFAVQAGYAFNERFSILAVKSGYVQFRPKNKLFTDQDGWVDLAAGAQYSFIYSPENQFVVTGRLIYEFTTGNDQVFQGNGDGNFTPSVMVLKGFGNLQLEATLGFVIPVDSDEENTLFFDSWHVSYRVLPWFHPLLELNHFHVLDSGDRVKWVQDAIDDGDIGAIAGALGTSRQDDVVATVLKSSGCDIINTGGANSDEHRDLVSLAIGARFPITSWFSVGYAYEFALTDEENGLLDDRHLFDAVITINF